MTNQDHGRIRVVYRMAIGIEHGKVKHAKLLQALYALDDSLTRITGGIVRLDGSGTWAKDSESGDFTGPLERNTTFTYLLSVTPDQEVKALTDVHKAAKSVIETYALPVTHIHMERSLVEACHFATRL